MRREIGQAAAQLLLQELQAALRLVDRSAFDRQKQVTILGIENRQHLVPVHHAVATGAADRRSCDLASLGGALLEVDVLGVNVPYGALYFR